MGYPPYPLLWVGSSQRFIGERGLSVVLSLLHSHASREQIVPPNPARSRMNINAVIFKSSVLAREALTSLSVPPCYPKSRMSVEMVNATVAQTAPSVMRSSASSRAVRCASS